MCSLCADLGVHPQGNAPVPIEICLFVCCSPVELMNASSIVCQSQENIWGPIIQVAIAKTMLPEVCAGSSREILATWFYIGAGWERRWEGCLLAFLVSEKNHSQTLDAFWIRSLALRQQLLKYTGKLLSGKD